MAARFQLVKELIQRLQLAWSGRGHNADSNVHNTHTCT